MSKRLRVFISSTSEDLKDYRAAARFAVLDMDWMPVMMEHFGAMAVPTVQACYDKLDSCDLMVLVVAFRRGWVPERGQGGDDVSSITALELRRARERNIPVLAMLANDNWPGNLWEDKDPPREWVKQFRNGLNLPATFFSFESPDSDESRRCPQFRSQLATALTRHHEQLLKDQGAARGIGGRALAQSASDMCRSGLCIPFLGPDVYDNGPLSTNALIQALSDRYAPGLYLAEAAEHCEHAAFSRPLFLRTLEQVLDAQMQVASEPVVYDLLLRERPPLIVSTTADLMLERRIEREHKAPLILCHVLRSEGDEVGRIAKYQGPNDANPQIQPADRLELSDREDRYVIYKPLGSALLHRGRANLDTAVITEADHLLLLGRLESQSSGIPNLFSRTFQRDPFVFLGYSLDVWHYRLVMKVFQSLGGARRDRAGIAVRKPSSALEERAWSWLRVDLLPMDPNDFARDALPPRAHGGANATT